MTKNEMPMHHWEQNGLGFAPFHIVGQWDLPKNRQPPFSKPPKGFGNPGVCAVCGKTGLVHHYLVESADRRRFFVGQQCAWQGGRLLAIEAHFAGDCHGDGVSMARRYAELGRCVQLSETVVHESRKEHK